MLKLRFKNNKHNGVWLVEPKVTIGRSSGNDLVIEDPSVAEHHAEILVSHEQLTLVNSAGQTLLVNKKPVEGKQTLAANDQLMVGQVALEVIDPKQEQARAAASAKAATGWALKANHAALTNRVYPIKAETVIGRSNECDITLAAAHLSRRHVKLVVEDGLLYARDLGSANGTYLNGERITEARVRRGDELRFDTLSFGVIGPASEDLDKTSIRRASSAVKQPQAAQAGNDGPARPAAAARSTRVQNPGPAPSRRQDSAPSQTGAVSPATNSGRSRMLWALGLAGVLAAAAVLAWQQGLLGQ